MSIELFKKSLLKRYPEMADLRPFNVEKFATKISNLMTTRKFAIGQIENLKDHIIQLLRQTDPQSPVLCQLEAINLPEAELGVQDASPLRVLAAVANEERHSSGGSEGDVDERVVPEAYRENLRVALLADIRRIFPRLTMEQKEENARIICGILNVFKKERLKFIR